MNDQALVITPARVLTGHTDAETAYRVSDYPYGSGLRCTMRCWVETATKGTGKGKQRFVRQTNNPRREGEIWNKPHAGTYNALVVLYLDDQSHVHPWTVADFPSPDRDARMRLMGIYDQLTAVEQAWYDRLLALSQHPGIGSSAWQRWHDTVDALARHIDETGSDPEVVDGRWQGPAGPIHLGHDPAPYILTARQRAADKRHVTAS